MATKPSDVKNQLTQRANAQQGAEKPKTIQDLIMEMGPAMAQALPKHMDVDRFTRIVLTQIRTTPALRTCTAKSLLAAVIQAAQMGLEIGTLGHAYLVPFKNNKTQEVDAQLIIGYKGMLHLIRNSGQVDNAVARPVYENDHFVLEYGLQDKFEHVPWYLRKDKQYGDGGEFVGAYFISRFKDGGYYLNYMSAAQIEKRRQRSRAKSSGPWVEFPEEMQLKTVVRDSFKWLPVSVEIVHAVQQDETIKREIDVDMTNVVDVYEEEPGVYAPVDGDGGDDTGEPVGGSAEGGQPTTGDGDQGTLV